MEVLLDRSDGRLEVIHGRGSGSLTPDGAAWVVLERGSTSILSDGDRVEVEGRDGVFASPGWSALVAPGSTITFTGDAEWTAFIRPGACGPNRLIDPSDVVVEDRGDGPTRRTVRTYVSEGPLICGETVSPPGGWSSWPPHRHEHEEVYLYRFDDPDGFGMQLVYDGDPATPAVVRDGHVERIRGTYHPVVASPRSSMVYLWALAGIASTVTPEPDPRYT